MKRNLVIFIVMVLFGGIVAYVLSTTVGGGGEEEGSAIVYPGEVTDEAVDEAGSAVVPADSTAVADSVESPGW